MTLAASLLASCRHGSRPSIPPLPPEDDLYAYSVVVAERARAQVTESQALAVVGIGRVHERFGFQEKALEQFRAALEIDPRSADAFLRIGFVLSQRNQADAALDAYQQALLSNPGMPGVRTQIGLVFNHLGRFELAKRILEEEIERGLADAKTHYNLGQAHQLSGDAAAATASYRACLEREPTFREALHGLTRTLRQEGKLDEARVADERFAAVRRADEIAARTDGTITQANTRDLRKWTAETWKSAGDVFLTELELTTDATRRETLTRGAIHAAEESLRFDPDQLELWLWLEREFERSGDEEKAREIPYRIIEHVTTSPAALFDAASKLRDRAPVTDRSAPPREILAALDGLRRAIESSANNGRYRLAACNLILFRTQSPELAREALDHALEAMNHPPLVPENFDLLAFAYYRTGDLDRAIEVLSDGTRRFPDHEGMNGRLEKLQRAREARP